MRYDQKPQPGALVYLAPRTRLAGRFEHSRAPVRVVHYDQWPWVVVTDRLEVTLPGMEPEYVDGQNRTVHADNLALHPSRQTAVGDMAEKQERKIPKPLGGKRPCELGPGEEQGTLW